VALPTETVYGLAADALNPDAVHSVFSIKKRPANDPLIVHAANLEQVESIAFAPPVLKKLAKSFWPGPLTIILRKKDIVPDIVTSGLPTVAVRVPSHPLFRKILLDANRPLAAPSANPFGYVSPTQAEHVVSSFAENCPVVLDGGPTDHGIESTILSLDDPKQPKILRLGPLSPNDLAQVLGCMPVIVPSINDAIPMAPGCMKRHYSPNVALKLHHDQASIKNEVEGCTNPRSVGVLLLQRSAESKKFPSGIKLLCLSEEGNLREAASRLYDSLRKMDSDPLLEIVHCETLSDRGIGAAINDRLRRAASQD